MKISTAGVVRRVQKKVGRTYSGQELRALELRVREWLAIREAVKEMEAEYDERLHEDIMNDIFGDHGQG